MFKKRRDGPKIYVTRTGGFYVKAEELLRSEKGQQRLREAAKLAERLNLKPRRRSG